jgi:hypothetical protein
VAGLFGQHGQAAHEGAANTEDMDVHGGRNECPQKSECTILPDAMPFSVQEYDHGHDANAK